MQEEEEEKREEVRKQALQDMDEEMSLYDEEEMILNKPQHITDTVKAAEKRNEQTDVADENSSTKSNAQKLELSSKQSVSLYLIKWMSFVFHVICYDVKLIIGC